MTMAASRGLKGISSSRKSVTAPEAVNPAHSPVIGLIKPMGKATKSHNPIPLSTDEAALRRPDPNATMTQTIGTRANPTAKAGPPAVVESLLEATTPSKKDPKLIAWTTVPVPMAVHIRRRVGPSGAAAWVTSCEFALE